MKKIILFKKSSVFALFLMVGTLALFVSCSGSGGNGMGGIFELEYEKNLGRRGKSGATRQGFARIPSRTTLLLPDLIKGDEEVAGARSVFEAKPAFSDASGNPELVTPESLREKGIGALKEPVSYLDRVSGELAMKFLEVEKVREEYFTSKPAAKNEITSIVMTDEFMREYASRLADGVNNKSYKKVQATRHEPNDPSPYVYDNAYQIAPRSVYKDADIPGYADMYTSEDVSQVDRKLVEFRRKKLWVEQFVKAADDFRARLGISKLKALTVEELVEIGRAVKNQYMWWFPGVWKIVWSEDGNESKVKIENDNEGARSTPGIFYLYNNIAEKYMVYRFDGRSIEYQVYIKEIVPADGVEFSGFFVRMNVRNRNNNVPVGDRIIVEGLVNDNGGYISYRRDDVFQSFDSNGTLVYSGPVDGASPEERAVEREIRKVIRENKRLEFDSKIRENLERGL